MQGRPYHNQGAVVTDATPERDSIVTAQTQAITAALAAYATDDMTI